MDARRVREGVKLNRGPISSPKGTNSIAVGTAHGRDRIDDQPCTYCQMAHRSAGLLENVQFSRVMGLSLCGQEHHHLVGAGASIEGMLLVMFPPSVRALGLLPSIALSSRPTVCIV